MKITTSIATLFLFLLTASCAIEPSVEVNRSVTRRALLQGEIKEALVTYESRAREAEKDAVASSSPQQYWRTAAITYVEASRAAGWTGQFQKSINYGAKALEIADKLNDPDLRLRAISVLNQGYRFVRSFDQARQIIEEGLRITKEIPSRNVRFIWEAALQSNLGHDLMRRQEYEKAIDAFSQSLSLREDSLNFYSRASVRNQSLIETLQNQVVNSLTYVANANLALGKQQEALAHYQRAFQLIKMWELRYANGGILYQGIGEIYLQEKNYTKAKESFSQALAVAADLGRPDWMISASVRIGEVSRQTGKFADAIPHYQKAIQQIESARSLLQSEEYRQLYLQGGLDVYVGLIRVLSESGKTEEAFGYSERARSRAFLDSVGIKARLSRLKGGLIDEERALHEQIAEIRARLSGEEDGEYDRPGLIKELGAAERAYNSFLAKVRGQDKEQASLMSVEPLTLKQVQELIDPTQTLIEYFVTDDEVLLWVVEKDKLNFQRVALSKSDLAKQVKTLREMISPLGSARDLNTVSTSLYKSLIQPILLHITGNELIIVPHDVLHYLPFQALLGSDEKYLVEKYSISYLSSASLLQFVKEKSTAGRDRVLAFGNPDLGDPEKDLEYAELEAQEVKAVYPEANVFVRKEATEEKSKSLSANHDILHFATHAQLNESDPLSSAVLLAKDGNEDGRLEVREIFGMDLKANLVVLSGCETGLGKLSIGDELVGLTRAFIYAGTPSVVASLWKVDDSSTAHLMSNFYKNLKTMTKVDALRKAQMDLIRGNGRSDLLAKRGIGGIGKLGETPASQLSSQDSISVSTSHPYF